MSSKLPRIEASTISVRDIENAFDVDSPSLSVMKVAYQDHMRAYPPEHVPELMAYMALLPAIEIYLKIHIVVFAHHFFVNESRENFISRMYLCFGGVRFASKSTTGRIMPFGTVKFRCSELINHNIHTAIEVFCKLADIESKYQRELNKKCIGVGAGSDWTVLRYDTTKVPETSKLSALFKAFENFRNHLDAKGLSCLGKLGE